ncbi:MAG: gluconate 2-dehydrogenase subunit 3 family protein [Xanthomonadales bacterium]|nr:gluconate 2-dehydrogenase subunit 3 family protein [Xanthomonadales bacterium]
MERSDPISRRHFLGTTSSALGSGWIALQWPAFMAAAGVACSRREEGEGFAHLDDRVAWSLEALAEQIIPADEFPGAREAGVIWFIDELLGGAWAGSRAMLESGVAMLDEQAGGGRRFVDLPFDEQTRVVRQIESDSFFSTMRLLTLAGMFAMPALGGNREKIGWALIGFEDRHAWFPPFGYYDAAAKNTPAPEDHAE